ncbi:hypothetical protein PSPO_b1154 [Pseudoalteromonas spongiae UST010723-006]|nr:hypothetical protein PSPO_b1154 [Pseudoalteromonas spongiae UST010723-006]
MADYVFKLHCPYTKIELANALHISAFWQAHFLVSTVTFIIVTQLTDMSVKPFLSPTFATIVV